MTMTATSRAVLVILAAACAPGITSALASASASASALASVSAPAVAKAPGRVVFSVDGGAVMPTEGNEVRAAVGLPNGDTVVIGPAAGGFYAAELTPSGSLERSFGDGGISRVKAPASGDQVFAASDGKLVVASDSSPATLVRLDADGSLDPTFGAGGIADVDVYPDSDDAFAQLPDGGFVVTGTLDGKALPPNGFNPDPVWAVAQLTSNGLLDQSFGHGGIATVPLTYAYAGDAATMPNGDIVTLGSTLTGVYLTRLLQSGQPDPTFNGGVPAELPGGGHNPINLLLAQPDGAVVVEAPTGLIRYTPAGAQDRAFGTNGVLTTGFVPGRTAAFAEVLPGPDGGLILVLVTLKGSHLLAERVTSTGAVSAPVGPPGGFAIPFAGGLSNALASGNFSGLETLAQNGFSGVANGPIIPRPDGSYMLVGSVSVVLPKGEADGQSIVDVGAAALTPSFAPDRTFGGSATRLQATVAITSHVAASARKSHAIRVELKLSASGLCLVTVKAQGRAIAANLLPVFAANKETSLPVELTPYGTKWLAAGHRGKLTVAATARDLLANTATARATGTLR